MAYIPVQERRQYLQEIKALGVRKGYPPPMSFEGRAPAHLENNLRLQAQLAERSWSAVEAPEVWLGEPIESRGRPRRRWRPDERANLLIAGGNEAEAYGVLLATVVSIAAPAIAGPGCLLRCGFCPAGHGTGRACSATWRYSGSGPGFPHSITLAGPRGPWRACAVIGCADVALNNAEGATPALYFVVAGFASRDLPGADAYMQSEAAKQLSRLADQTGSGGPHPCDRVGRRDGNARRTSQRGASRVRPAGCAWSCREGQQ